MDLLLAGALAEGAHGPEMPERARELASHATEVLDRLEKEGAAAAEVARARVVAAALGPDRAAVARLAAAARSRLRDDPQVELAERGAEVHAADRSVRDRAVGSLGMLVARRPELTRARYLLARGQGAEGKRAEALATVEGLLRANPQHEGAVTLRAELVAATAKPAPPPPSAPPPTTASSPPAAKEEKSPLRRPSAPGRRQPRRRRPRPRLRLWRSRRRGGRRLRCGRRLPRHRRARGEAGRRPTARPPMARGDRCPLAFTRRPFRTRSRSRAAVSPFHRECRGDLCFDGESASRRPPVLPNDCLQRVNGKEVEPGRHPGHGCRPDPGRAGTWDRRCGAGALCSKRRRKDRGDVRRRC